MQTLNVKSRTILSNEDLNRIAPSIFAEHAASHLTERYAFFPTSRVVDAMRGAGWNPVAAQEMRARKEERRGFQTHVVRFQKAIHTLAVGDSVFELILKNAHDGGCSWQMHAGLYRATCANGMVVSEGVSQQANIRHSGREIDEIISNSFSIAERLPLMAEHVGKFSSRLLTDTEARTFAAGALALRYEANEAPIKAEALLTARRAGDVGNDLWRTFNRVQENLMRGKQRGYKITAASRGFLRKVSTRPVTAINEDLRINKELWSLAESFSA